MAPRFSTALVLSQLVLGLCGLSQANTHDVQCVLNDNFCDCGNDEPETAACSFYSSDRFRCRSKVYVNQTIPLSKVDDGVCDCCDGSDEVSFDVTCMLFVFIHLFRVFTAEIIAQSSRSTAWR
jgi:hypothetical protein